MSALQIEISDADRAYVEKVARLQNATTKEVAEELIREAIKSLKKWEYLEERAKRGASNPKSLKQILQDIAPDGPPVPGDELPEGWNKH